MILPEICEDFFQYVCRLTRTSRLSGEIDSYLLRQQVKKLLQNVEERARKETRIDHIENLKLILVFFVDSLIVESSLSFSEEWNNDRLAYEYKEHAGDQKFYEILKEALEDHSQESTELLGVFHTCLGLGFIGHPPEDLARIKQKISGRILNLMDSGASMTIPNEEYHVDITDMRPRQTPILLVITIALIGLTIVLLVANNLLFRSHTNELRESLETVLNYGE